MAKKRPASEAAPADSPDLLALLGRLQQHLIVGDIDAAATGLAQSGKTPQTLVAQANPQTPAGMTAATVVAEIEFALGHDEVAQQLLERYDRDPGALLSSSLAARHKLQLAEYHYSRFKNADAVTAAQGILLDAGRAGDMFGVGECHFYLARFRLRQDMYVEANNHCMLGLESFHRAPARTEPDPQQARWQTGRLLRVRGTALWQQGRLTEAKAVLYLSAWILKDSHASRIHVGDALHALGRLLRSDGPSRYDEAIEALERARKHYAHHDLKLARTLTELARARHNMGLTKVDEGAEAAALALFEQSHRDLNDALALSRRHSEVAEAPIVWLRQRIEALVWSSWLKQESGPLADLEAAFKDASDAVKGAEAIPSRMSDLIEARLALGQCEMARGNYETAGATLEEARDQADELKESPKLRFHAHLSLAQLECRQGQNLRQAQRHFEAASRVSDSDQSIQLSSYLLAKAEAVRKEIDAFVLETGSLILTKEMLDSKPPERWTRLDVLSALTQKWALDTVVASGQTQTNAAVHLGRHPSTSQNIKKRAKDLEAALKTAGHKRASP